MESESIPTSCIKRIRGKLLALVTSIRSGIHPLAFHASAQPCQVRSDNSSSQISFVTNVENELAQRKLTSPLLSCQSLIALILIRICSQVTERYDRISEALNSIELPAVSLTNLHGLPFTIQPHRSGTKTSFWRRSPPLRRNVSDLPATDSILAFLSYGDVKKPAIDVVTE